MPMNPYTNTFLSLPQFSATRNPTFSKSNKFNTKYNITTIHGKSTAPLPRKCPHCGNIYINHIHQHLKVKLKHLSVGNNQIIIEVEYIKLLCTKCNRKTSQPIEFKQPHHFITKCFYNQIIGMIKSSQIPIKTISETLFTNRKLVKYIDKNRLKDKYKNMKPTHYSPYIAIDEFSIQKGHRYATVVMDWQTGEILFLERGKTIYQLLHFFDKMGRNWMSRVKAISMDMNANYSCAIKAKYPNIAIIYDGFHIIKNFNDRILTELRRLEQNRLREAEAKDHSRIRQLRYKKKRVNIQEQRIIENEIFEYQSYLKDIQRKYKELKNTRFLITSSRKALERKDEIAKKHNRYLYEKYEKKGLNIPEDQYKWSISNVQKLEKILACNENIEIAYFLGDQLKAGLDATDAHEMERGMDKWLALSRSFEKEIPMLKSFNKMIDTRIDGIISRIKYPISNGPLEGLNNMIKVTKRVAYGYRDDEYFFYKLFDKSRQNIKSRTLKSAIERKIHKNIVV